MFWIYCKENDFILLQLQPLEQMTSDILLQTGRYMLGAYGCLPTPRCARHQWTFLPTFLCFSWGWRKSWLKKVMNIALTVKAKKQAANKQTKLWQSIWNSLRNLILAAPTETRKVLTWRKFRTQTANNRLLRTSVFGANMNSVPKIILCSIVFIEKEKKKKKRLAEFP